MPRRLKPLPRRCVLCRKPGHNAATCLNARATIAASVLPKKTATAAAPTNQALNSAWDQADETPRRSALPRLSFFVHHVPTPNVPSPHQVDLKRQTQNIWEEVRASQPAESVTPWYHFRSKSVPQPNRPQPLFSALNQPAPPLTKGWAPVATLPGRASKQLTEWSRALIALGATTLNRLRRGSVKLAPASLVNLAPPRRLAVALVILLAVLIAPSSARSFYQRLKSSEDLLLERGARGVTALQNSVTALAAANLPTALNSAHQALQEFSAALETLRSQNQALVALGRTLPKVGSSLESGQKLLLAGEEIALGEIFLLQEAIRAKRAPASGFLPRLENLAAALSTALPYFERANQHLQSVTPDDLPPGLTESFRSSRERLKTATLDLQHLVELSGVIPEIFGGRGARRYLLTFQNPAELRPTGGFMGSLAILEINNGAVTKLEVPPGGTYDLQGQVNARLVPPAPLLLLNPSWEFQDANWFPDWPASAEKILWFFRRARGVTADGVIAINATVLPRLLSVLGPITEPSRQLTLQADSALTTLQNLIAEGPDRKYNRPKQVLTDLVPIIQAAFTKLTPGQTLALLAELSVALAHKEVQVYVTDEPTQALIRSFGWGGALTQTQPGQDYLLVVNTNLRGAKSDARIRQHISHEAVVQTDGTIEVTVTITRAHQGVRSEPLYGHTNISYLRLYVPRGSTLLAGSGFRWPDEKVFQTPESWYQTDPALASLEREVDTHESSGTRITEEFGKTVFGNWVITEPGEESLVRFTYRLPWVVASSPALARYQLIAEPQSGSPSSFESQIIFPPAWAPRWGDGPALTLAKNGALITPLQLPSASTWSILMQSTDR